jgi:hypothetical protein
MRYHRSMARRFSQHEVAKLIEAAVSPLQAKIAQSEAEVAGLQAKVDQLESENARLKKDSSTSSKPPSNDIVKPPPPPLPGGKRKKRRRGGRPSHPERFVQRAEGCGLLGAWPPPAERVLQFLHGLIGPSRWSCTELSRLVKLPNRISEAHSRSLHLSSANGPNVRRYTAFLDSSPDRSYRCLGRPLPR